MNKLDSIKSVTAFAIAASAFQNSHPLAEDDSTTIELAPFVVDSRGSLSVLQITERYLSQRQATDLEDVLSIDLSITVGGSVGVAQKI